MKRNCFCGSTQSFEACCAPYISGANHAPTAETLMRSRYSAYATHAIDYLIRTTHCSERLYLSKNDIMQWATTNTWQKLEILVATSTTVNFKAYFMDQNRVPQIHHELSAFVIEDGLWYYVDGSFF